MKRIFILLLAAALCLPLLSCSTGDRTTVRIGVLREDDTSGEAKAWEHYLKTVGEELGFSVDFTTTDSSSAEVSAINTYASKGYQAILLFSDDDLIASVTAAAAKKMYVVYPTGQPTDEQYARLKDNPYFLGSVAPSSDTEFRAGYDMAKFFVEDKQQSSFTLFGGAALYGSDMHVQRLAGMLAYLCEDPGTDYDGVKDRASLAAKLSGSGVDPAKFHSGTYRVVGYMDGFSFDDAFTTKLTASLEGGGTCILTVGAGDVVTKIAYGIEKSNARVESFLSGGVDAITADYGDCFDLGYAYDCGKYASAMAPGLILTLAALRDHRITNADGSAPRIDMSYWVADNKQLLESMLYYDNPDSGYCYDGAVIDRYADGTLAELVTLCGADYTEARSIRDAVHEDADASGEGSGT